ncbi:single-stranded DNA-binding protein [Corynebacterium glyciniphilum]|uniref:single-stranded DNA-binding protein n=2 Tax=Corynebacterium glyciniphilum TaxID=1404244 RepID=UPI0026505DA2|nr:single-stranded DNA-binding protein [Corynebacterium glyciniphilum]MDN6706925.1 single-stranded DNA-binding protein [Corynebacterium glyciniphilum]
MAYGDVITIRNARITDPGVELKTSKAGKEYASLTVMWSTNKKNRQTGETEFGPTKFVRVTVLGFDAQDIAAAVNGGDRVDVTGSIEHTTFTKKDGSEGDSWDLLAERVTLPVPRGGNGGQKSGGFGGQSQGGGFGGSEDAPF